MFNLYSEILRHPAKYRQLNCGDSLITLYNCPLESKFQDIWSHHNYIVYVIEGRKIWHTAQGSFDLRKDACVFVRKGASIVEQFFDITFCLVVFFIPDEFISEVLKSKKNPIPQAGKKYHPIIPIKNSHYIKAFFQSMIPYFESGRTPDLSLLELKFKELILTITEDAANSELLSYFYSLMNDPQNISLQRVMENNFRFNLKLEEFAKLSARSLSAFKRDFQSVYQTTPGKWLIEKRLQHAKHLLLNQNKTVSEAAYESGFENPSHFSTAFKQQFGFPPADIKKQLKGI